MQLTQQHAINARWKRVWQRAFCFDECLYQYYSNIQILIGSVIVHCLRSTYKWNQDVWIISLTSNHKSKFSAWFKLVKQKVHMPGRFIFPASYKSGYSIFYTFIKLNFNNWKILWIGRDWIPRPSKIGCLLKNIQI